MAVWHRIKQFYQACKAEFCCISQSDINFAAAYLTTTELNLWQNQTPADKSHSLNVARTAINLANQNKLSDSKTHTLIRAALLHDIGRGAYGTALKKSIAVILSAICGKKSRRLSSGGGWANDCLNTYYFHGAMGAAILLHLPHEDCGSDIETVANLIAHHHDAVIEPSDILLKILSEADKAS